MATHLTKRERVEAFIDVLPLPYRNYSDESLKKLFSDSNTYLHKRIEQKKKQKN